MALPASHPTLAKGIRNHLGQALAQAYAALPNIEQSDRFKELLAKLENVLVAQAGRDEQLFRDTLLKMTASLLNFALSLTRNATQAEDLVQETLLKAWRARDRFQAGTNQEAWLFTIMRNTFYTDRRRSVREVEDDDGGYAESLACIPGQEAHLDVQDVQVALAKLPSAMRETLILVAINELSYEEAAQIMDCAVGTVKSRVFRGREQLAAHLGYDLHEAGVDRITLAALEAGRRPEWT
ncbi:sigma-70 family RNA polymerase sigma factor [Methylobacterium oxalidis]|uniref:RNA polymerase sigma factor n=1 Tax=Methylobacterium oxalidis TaxID=944322 RepID=A0A512JD91_9HYPH|nr:sigma-70 family RNA polymerase sigma factor [Methylobacterium oxalidis]GEP07898.1 hypothetical protein MOX02_59360 [Methylobacterium oxalidis]GJE34755.1 hypothetical protein LDDCCGHA_4969 [Methylobacterium oxalidis]GLS66337.1 hypothetical protein GCM10007888_47190 [Methylobacterium oxalidis]